MQSSNALHGVFSIFSSLQGLGEMTVPTLSGFEEMLMRMGAALVLPEEGLDGKKLFAAAAGILNDPQRMETMSQNMAALGIPDATKRIYDTVMTLLK